VDFLRCMQTTPGKFLVHQSRSVPGYGSLRKTKWFPLRRIRGGGGGTDTREGKECLSPSVKEDQPEDNEQEGTPVKGGTGER